MEEKINEFTKKKRGGFSGKLGFVLAAAGSAVGLGNLWRFPYLTAEYGGGIFILTYIILTLFLGISLLMLEIGIGRYTGKSVIGAFGTLNKKFKWFGYLCVIVPLLVVPYYCVIGGWVLKYGVSFVVGSDGLISNSSSFFNNFIGGTAEPLIYFLIFAFITVLIVIFGVQKGIERMSKILMPTLAIIALFLMVYVFCLKGSGKGVKYTLLPDFSKFSFKTVLGALGQMFYSLSIGMCIMITYGSYMKKDVSIKSSAIQIGVCDSLFAIVASLIIIPSVFACAPTTAEAEGMLASPGPGLMFVQLTEVFGTIKGGRVIGTIFFILVFFAAVTSSVSLVESIVAVLCEGDKMKRSSACAIVFSVILTLGALSSLGFGVLDGVSINIAGNSKSILDMFDLLANNILLPIVGIMTCVIVGWFVDKKIIPKEIGIDKNKTLRGFFNVITKYVAPIIILIVLVSGLLDMFGVLKI
ncbi:MAG: sodium-dependent transporter [Clostridia bacterium]|nr:sodium-dependent transporter [Clostridia bacterium]